MGSHAPPDLVKRHPAQTLGLVVGYLAGASEPAVTLALSMAAGVLIGGPVWGLSIRMERWCLGRGPTKAGS
jgi:hypothetical protein